MNGLVNPDRKPNPQLWETKKVYQNIAIEAVDLATGKFKIRNKYFFTNLNEFNLSWTIKSAEGTFTHGMVTDLNVEPLSEKTFAVIIPELQKPKAGQVYVIKFSLTTKTRKGLVAAGHEQAWEEFELPVQSKQFEVIANKGEVSVQQGNDKMAVTGENFNLTIDPKTGIISSYLLKGTEMMKQGPRLNFFRPPTENDIRDRNGLRAWNAAGLDKLEQIAGKPEVRNQNDGTILMIFPLTFKSSSTEFSGVIQYQFFGDGTFNIASEVNIPATVSAVAKVGLQAKMKRSFDQLNWYGLGGVSTYPYRKSGGKFDF